MIKYCIHGFEEGKDCDTCYDLWRRENMKKSVEELLWELTESEQESIVLRYKYRKIISDRYNNYVSDSAELAKELQNIRDSCKHIAMVTTRQYDEDEYGKTTSYGTIKTFCPDCKQTTFTEFQDA